MCAIAGIFAYQQGAPKPALAELRAIRDHMSARGPDGTGEWASPDEALILGHRRLSIMDLSERANQPMHSADGALTVVFNGEIYNLPALRKALQADGAVFRTTSDTEALLHLYERRGPAFVTALEGMFAFALWDARAHRLLLARDPYGIKPLYYADDGKTLRFASQVKALAAGGAVDQEPDPAGLAGFCLFGATPEPFTHLEAVRALPSGATLLLEKGAAPVFNTYAAIPPVIAAAARAPAAPVQQATTALTAAVRAAVADHLLADVEVGLFLSAGVDSGALLGLMRDAGQAKVRAITLAFAEFEGLPADEEPLAAQVAAHYGAEHCVRRVNAAEFEADLPALFAAMDQPSIDGVNTWFVAKAAREAGLKVALSGLGGDELLGGYSTFRDVPALARAAAIPAALPGLGRFARHWGCRLAPGVAANNPKALSVLEYGGSFAGAYLLRRGLFLPHELPALLGSERAKEGLARLQPLALINAAMPQGAAAPKLRVAALETGLYMRHQLLRDADWAGMAHSLEIRTPLVHWPLLHAAAPHLVGLMGQGGKAALAAAPSRPLPEAILNRPKTGFSVPTKAWMAKAAAGGNDRLASRRWARTVLEQGFGLSLGQGG